MALINLDKHQKEHALLQLLQPEQTGDNLAAELAAIGVINARFRRGLPLQEGEVLVDFERAPSVSMGVTFGDGFARGSLLELADGRRKWSIKLNTPFGAGKETYCVIALGALSRVMAVTDVIEIQLYSPDGSIPRVFIGGNSTPSVAWKWVSVNNVGNISYIRRTGMYTLKISLSNVTAIGGIVISDTITKLYIASLNSGARGNNTHVVGKVFLNRKETTQVVISTDDGLPENIWLADQLASRGLRMTAYIIPSLIDTGGFLTSSQLAALSAKPNVQIASHSYSHIYVNGGPTGSVFGSSITGLCLSQAVAVGELLLNGAIGVSYFDKPRHLTFVTSSANSGVRVDIVGELDGLSQTESVFLGEANGYPFPTHKTWDKITSLTIAVPSGATAAGNITVGTSCSYDEIIGDLKKGFEYIEALGYSSPAARHYCAPQGQQNDTLFQVLEDLGVKTCRLTDVTTFSYTAEHDAYKYPACAIEEALQANILSYLTLAQQTSESIILYLHQIKTDNTAPVAGGIRASTLTPILDAIASMTADSVTMSDLYAKTYPAF
jgi:peptidoglycan/xylan/chitin deacetylase (PgdA/CDA1 family)